MDTTQARSNTIDQQIRPWGGLNYIANNALRSTPRESFVPEKYQNLAFADIEIPLNNKAKMLSPQEVIAYTGHAVGGVCPFGLNQQIDVYLDVSLKKHTEVIPAAGDHKSAIRLTLKELEKYSNYVNWVDVCKSD